MKTLLLTPTLDKLSTLNTELWFYLFVNEEFNANMAKFSERAKSLNTTDLFYKNKYSSRVDMMVKILPKFQSSNRIATTGSYFSMCYEILSLYVEELIKAIKRYNNITYRLSPACGSEENLQRCLLRGGIAPVDNNIINTIKYFRLLRNSIIHLLNTPSNTLTSLINSESLNLKTYWQLQSPNNTLEFNKSDFSMYSIDEIFEMIKLMRVCIQKIDSYMGTNINQNNIIRDVLLKYPLKLNSLSRARKIAKIQKHIWNWISLRLTEQQAIMFI